ncbi:DnaB-like helicase C-terminal domain-containing protein [Burkholderia cepacia]|uniref:DnaB-like helicase C-terminal domain-containing protein n=1 Tax=Burkholderia cepacia TaxID=292 RepID=UPI001CF25CCC|nr:DnaB-like helicase C-terminal domain-containing protein [Burkholderia cepacia]MCA8110272.1 toprim domain-containing protein [Burkholderia cepacia]MCA8396571.1 toprim domain-containing protein [Burkholderia cepacia]
MAKDLILDGEVRALPKRRITEETCAKFGYTVGTSSRGNTVQLAPYFDGTTLVAQKMRDADKNFVTLGDFKSAGLFGQQLWRDGGKKVVVTEGEIDCMTVSQLQGNKWPVVSVPNGAQGAKKALQKHLEWLEQFEEVVLLFDMDEPGREAMAECAPLFTPGKCKLASLPHGFKDPNEMLLAGRGSEVIDAIWGAKSYRPDGLVGIKDIKEQLRKPIEVGLAWCFQELTDLTYGRRYGEIYGIGAGTGVGKTDLLTQQIAYDISVLKLRVGTIFLEQAPTETAKRVAGKLKGKRFHVPDDGWTAEELDAAVDELEAADALVMYDSFGETEWDVVKAKVRFMAVSEGIRVIYIDHLTAMADTEDEKGSLEQIMKEMASLAKELDIIITFVSHLATPEKGKSHEEGGRVTIRHFKGSRAIGFWSYYMFGLERDQQAEDEKLRGITTFRVLKDRYTGQAVGQVIYLAYDSKTGLLKVLDGNPFDDETNSAPTTNWDSDDIPF